MGEVVMVKTEGEGDPEDPNKTQVILQLQPVTTGYVQKPGVSSWRQRKAGMGTEATIYFNTTNTSTGISDVRLLLGSN